jgi:hypothetical protein
MPAAISIKVRNDLSLAAPLKKTNPAPPEKPMRAQSPG